jgi:hypothetical protein
MKVKGFALLVTVLWSFALNGQMKKGIEYSGFFDSYYWRGPISITGGFGLASYAGDLCSDFSCSKIKPQFNLGVGYKLWPRVFIGGELNRFKLAATDVFPNRGFVFESKNTELAAYVNFYLLEDIVKRHNDLFTTKKIIKPYVHLGLSTMRYNVTVNATETDFPKYTFLIPVGAGLLVDYTPRVKFSLEAAYKFSFSDYLDGVSELASTEKNDGFGVLRAKVIYTPMAKRVHPKAMKLDEEEKEKWSNYYSQDSTKPAPKPATEPDPEEQDPYYQDQDQNKDQNGDNGTDTDDTNNQDGNKEEENTEEDLDW